MLHINVFSTGINVGRRNYQNASSMSRTLLPSLLLRPMMCVPYKNKNNRSGSRSGYRCVTSLRLAEIAWSSFVALALVALGNVFHATVFKKGLHLYFTAARAIEVMRGTRCTRVLTNLSHDELLGEITDRKAVTFPAKRKRLSRNCCAQRRPDNGWWTAPSSRQSLFLKIQHMPTLCQSFRTTSPVS